MRRPRLDWIDRDGKLLILAGCASAVVPASFNPGDIGSSAFQWTLLLFVGGIGGLFVPLIVVIFAEKVGRRRLLILLTLMSAAAVVLSTLTSNLLVLLPFVLFGALSHGRGGIRLTHVLLQASMADTAPPNRRTELYAMYDIAKALTHLPVLLVGLLVSVPFIFLTLLLLLGLNRVYQDYVLAPVSVLLLLATAFLYSRVSPAVEAPVEARRAVNPFKLPSRRFIFTLTGLLSLNSLGTTILFMSVTIYSSINWSEEGQLDRLFTNLTAVSLAAVLAIPALWLAAKIANRFGLVKILALTQMLSPLFFVAVAFIPSGVLSVLLRVMYYVLGQMSTPLRASYMMGIVTPGERVAMAGIVLLGMSFMGMVGPVFGGFFYNIGQMATPLFAGTALVIVSNAALYRLFRNVKPPEEMGTTNDESTAP